MYRSNLEMLQVIATGLADLKEDVVFVGGAVAELYVQNPGAAPVRPTVDVDLIVHMVSKTELASIENQLRQLDFSNDMSENAPICRWLHQGIKVDIMPTDTSVLGFSNVWYDIGYEQRMQVKLPSSDLIYILPPAIYVCTKLSATLNRGYPDLTMSHDFEDLVYLINNRQRLLEDFRQSDERVKTFIGETLKEFQSNPHLEEAIIYALPYGETDKLEIIQHTMNEMMAHQ